MRIVICGTGALACRFGAALTVQNDVTLVGTWQAQIDALNSGPLRVIDTDGRKQHIKLAARHSRETLQPSDVALVLTKSARTEAAAQIAKAALKPEGIAVTLQNGLGNQQIVAKTIPPERVVSGITMSGAALEKPGVLRLGGDGPTHIAAKASAEPLLSQFVEALRAAGFTVQVADNLDSLIWGKLAINAAINPLTAILRVRNGMLLDSEEARGLLRAAALEVEAVAAAQGIALPFEDVAGRVEEVAAQTAANHSSMYQDVLRGAETEIEAINGAVLRAAQVHGIKAPVNQQLYHLIKAIEELAMESQA